MSALDGFRNKTQLIDERTFTKLVFEGMEIDVSKRLIYRDNREINVTYIEVEILYLLAKGPGRVFSKEQIYDIVWKEPYFGDYNIVIKKKYDWKYPSHGREPQLCFYSDIGLLSEDMHAGYEQFCENIGGELARDALKNEYPQLYEYLRANGKAFLVKFKIPFSNIKDYNQDSIIYQFVSYYAGKYFWNYDYEIQFDGNADKGIPATNIIELISYTVNRYYFYE